MEYTAEILAKVRSMGTLNYHAERIIKLIEPDDPDQFRRDFYNKSSIIFKEYEKGVIYAEYQIDKKLFELAKEGDVKALEIFELRRLRD